jgi:hypothetical protein
MSLEAKVGYVAIRDLSRQALYEMEEQGTHKLQRAIYYALQCVKKLSFVTLTEPKTVRLKVNDNKSIDLPPDYINYIKIGVQVNTDKGPRVLTFALNEQLPLASHTDECGNPLRTLGSICDHEDAGGYWYNNYQQGSNVGRIFGYGGGQSHVGTFTVDREFDRITFSSELALDYVYMEYITNGINPNGNTYVHALYEFPLIAYIIWKLTKIPGERQKKENEYFRELRDMKKVKLAFSVKEYLLSTRKRYGLAPK